MIKGIVRICANELKRESIKFENKTSTFDSRCTCMCMGQSVSSGRTSPKIIYNPS